MYSPWINEKAQDALHLTHLKNLFMSAQPYPHVVIPEFLAVNRVGVIAHAVKRLDFREKDADLFSFFQSDDLVSVRAGVLKEMYEFLSAREFAQYMGAVTGVGIMPGGIDVFASHYIYTHYLLCHDDRVGKRKLAYILYLGDDFNEKDGGALAMHDTLPDGQPGEVARKYYPTFGTLLVFAVSSRSFHAVEEVVSKGKHRYAISGWLA